jgi:hypothetical protein
MLLIMHLIVFANPLKTTSPPVSLFGQSSSSSAAVDRLAEL